MLLSLDISLLVAWRLPDAEWQSARVEEINSDLTARIVRLEVLLELKREAGRPRDLADIDALTKLYEE
jgi:hypothetical protein